MNSAMRIILFILCLVILTSAGACSGSERVLRVRDGKLISFRAMIRELSGTSIILVGENHDEKQHHAAQLAVIKALHKKKRALAVGMEMFPAETQKELDRWTGGKADFKEFVRLYYENWQMPWPLYRDILLYVRDYRIPLLGLNVPREISGRVAAEGFAALSSEEKKRLPPDITCNVDPVYMAFIRNAYRAHGHGMKSFVHFCETQKLWNRSMAWYLTRYLEKNPQHSVVVVTGAGHALRRAIPAEIKDLSSFSSAVILPQMNDMPPETVTAEDADYILLNR